MRKNLLKLAAVSSAALMALSAGTVNAAAADAAPGQRASRNA